MKIAKRKKLEGCSGYKKICTYGKDIADAVEKLQKECIEQNLVAPKLVLGKYVSGTVKIKEYDTVWNWFSNNYHFVEYRNPVFFDEINGRIQATLYFEE